MNQDEKDLLAAIASRGSSRPAEPAVAMLMQIAHPNGRDMLMQIVNLPLAMFELSGLITVDRGKAAADAQVAVQGAINGLFTTYVIELDKIKKEASGARPGLIT